MILPHRSLLLALLFFPVLCSCLLAPRTFDEDAWRLKVEEQNSAKLYAAHEKDGRFFNPWLVQEKGRFGQFLKWRMTRSKVYTDEEESYLPGFEPDLLQRLKNMPTDKDLLVWIGHATFLIRLSGSYWLTDPILSERALLPKRLTSPALSPGQLGELDGPLTVVISHNHYDHFDQETLEELPAHTRFIVPLGLGELVSTLHGGEVTEIDWWQEVRSGQTLVTGLPAQHWSRRIGQGHNRTLWASYMIES
ncbi:MAG: MBL fold metallo-hydrolase, partial [Desulfocapsaceae bacterium]